MEDYDNKKQINSKQLIIRITISLLLGSIAVSIVFILYLKNIALHTLTKREAKKTSKLIFEVMKTKMLEGWNKQDLEKIIKRLDTLKYGLDIKSYRSQKVEELFGKDLIAEDKIKNDSNIAEVLKSGKEKLVVGKDDSMYFYYPMKVKKQCMACHHNTKVGDVNGVLYIHFLPNEISIPLYAIIFYFILFLIIFLALVLVVFYFILNNKIVAPLVNFTEQMQEIIKDGDFNKRVTIDTNIKEIGRLEFEFNNLLKQIKYYYKKMISQFYIDQMTNLPNLLALKRDIENCENQALAIFNINQFKNINNFYGYEVGDFILKSLAKVIKKLNSSDGKLYRISGDEFAWLKQGMINLYDLLELLEELEEYPFVYKDSEIHLSISCGIAQSDTRLIENATTALFKAKTNSKPFEIYDNTTHKDEKIEKIMYWTKELRIALKEDRILIYFQPIYNISKNKSTKFETLIRLRGEDGTIFSPAEFMQAAKLSRLYLRLTRKVVKKAFEYFKDKPYEFSINVSMDDIADVTNKNYIINMLKQFPQPQRVVFELLETEEIIEFELINDFAKKVHKCGAKLAIDDFGSGYSNYDYVIKLNVDFLKIDSSLIKNVDKDKQIAIVVESIINSSKKLGLKTIAEYVHSKSVMDKVKELGVDYVQGYYIDKPLSDVKECKVIKI